MKTTVTFKPNGIVSTHLLFYYYDAGRRNQILFDATEDVDIYTLNFDEYEETINKLVIKDTKTYVNGMIPNVRITGLKVQTLLTAEGFNEKNEAIKLSEIIEESEMVYVGGVIVERDEILKTRYGGNLKKFNENFPLKVKGLRTSVPNQVIPYIEGQIKNISRAVNNP